MSIGSGVLDLAVDRSDGLELLEDAALADWIRSSDWKVAGEGVCAGTVSGTGDSRPKISQVSGLSARRWTISIIVGA